MILLELHNLIYHKPVPFHKAFICNCNLCCFHEKVITCNEHTKVQCILCLHTESCMFNENHYEIPLGSYQAVYQRPKVFGRSRRFLTFGFDFGCWRSMPSKAEGLAEGWNFLKFNKSNYKFCDKKFKITRVHVFPIITVTTVFKFQKG